MNIILSVDKSNGMLFNDRRVSRDKIANEKIFELCNNELYIDEFSKDMFPNANTISQNEISNLSSDKFYFAEQPNDIPIDKVNKFYIFNWNRDYPAEVYFDFDLNSLGFKKSIRKDFVGNSHKKITLTIFERGV